MEEIKTFDVIIVGGSSAGLSAAMALGRSLKKVLIIDNGKPCNKPTPHSHNFITHDGRKPSDIMEAAKTEVLNYPTVQFLNSTVVSASGSNNNFTIGTSENKSFKAKKLLFATGVRDILPAIKGLVECWGTSVIHCPYCHGYEFKGQQTGILMNGDLAADFSKFISNWTDKLTLFTNGKSTVSLENHQTLSKHNINVFEKEIKILEHESKYLKKIWFVDGTSQTLNALYARTPFEQHSKLPEVLGCTLTEMGHIQVDEFKKTTVPGIYAAGDNTTPFRSVANAVAAGNLAGAMINHEIITETFV